MASEIAGSWVRTLKQKSYYIDYCYHCENAGSNFQCRSSDLREDVKLR